MVHFDTLSPVELLRMYGAILDEFRTRGIVRTSNNPLADYTEWLVAQKLNLIIQANSTAGYDALDHLGRRYQIKARRGGYHLSALRNADQQMFDYVIAVIYTHDFDIELALKIPYAVVMHYARYTAHTHSHTLVINTAIIHEPTVENITVYLRETMPPSTRMANTIASPPSRINRPRDTVTHDQGYLDRRIQTIGKTNFVLLCAALLRGSHDDHALMRLIPDSNALSSKRSILSTARRLVDDGHTHAVLTIILRSNLDATILAEAQHLRDSLR